MNVGLGETKKMQSLNTPYGRIGLGQGQLSAVGPGEKSKISRGWEIKQGEWKRGKGTKDTIQNTNTDKTSGAQGSQYSADRKENRGYPLLFSLPLQTFCIDYSHKCIK